MKIQLLSTLKKYKKDYLKQDIFSGIIIVAVSIPISMGYAQIAGLPPAYGLSAELPISFGICMKIIVKEIPLMNPPITGVDIKFTIRSAFIM